MALTTKLAAAAQNAMADALGAQVNAGFLDIYDGAQPAGPGTAVTTQVKLARLAYSTPAFGAAVNGVATANPITGANALAGGTAAWFRSVKADGLTAVSDGSVGTANANLLLNSVNFVAGAPVAVTAMTITVPAAGT